MQAHALEVVNLRNLVGDIVNGDKQLLSNIFLDVGAREFVVIRRSGLYFGFLFGLLQARHAARTAALQVVHLDFRQRANCI